MVSKAWQKHLLRSIAFFVVLFVLVALAGDYLKPHSNRYLAGYTAGGILGEDFDTIDVLVMGDSNVAQGIAPMEWYAQYGYTGYAYGAGWFSPYKAYYRLEQIYQEQCPKVVVLGTGMIYSVREGRSWLQNAVWDILGEKFPLLRFHDNWKYLTASNLTEDHDYSWRDVNKGFTPITDVAPYLGGDYMEGEGMVELDPGVKLYLKKILALCEEHDTQVILVTIPAPGSWNIMRHNGAAAFAEENNLTYIDYNTDITSLGLDWNTCTSDGGNHLNYWGAKIVTDALGRYLEANYTLEDHRGQTNFADWDEDSVAYADTLAKIATRAPAGWATPESATSESAAQ